jgi:AcrR family transcriptional regulator
MTVQSIEGNSMPRTAEQFEEMREKSRAIIQNAALKLFAKNGFYGTTIQQISKEANIAAGLLYNYYSSKEELMHEIIQTRLQRLVEALQQKRAEILNAPSIVDSANIVFDAASEELEFWRLMIQVSIQHEGFQPSSDHDYKQVGLFYQFQVEILTDLFRKNGQTEPEERAQKCAYLLHGAFLAFCITMDKRLFAELALLIFK